MFSHEDEFEYKAKVHSNGRVYMIRNFRFIADINVESEVSIGYVTFIVWFSEVKLLEETQRFPFRPLSLNQNYLQNYPYDTQSATFYLASLDNNKNLIKITTETFNDLNGVDHDAEIATKDQTKLKWDKQKKWPL